MSIVFVCVKISILVYDQFWYPPLVGSALEFWSICRLFWINTYRIPEVYLLLPNDRHKIRMR